MSAQCSTLQVGARFCDKDGQIRECQPKQLAAVLSCGDNEQCVESEQGAKCDCKSGFVRQSECEPATDCAGGGGCDPLTKCNVTEGGRMCTECPPGYTGTGESGCVPTLSGLQVSGVLSPEFSPAIREYRVQLPFLTPSLQLTASSSVATGLSVAGQPAMFGAATEVTVGSESTIAITVRTDKARGDYTLSIERLPAAQQYVKASQVDPNAWYGAFVAIEGTTAVVGAPFEASGETDKVGGAYVLSRGNDGVWHEAARLQAPEIVGGDLYGSAVAISGDRIAVGALGHDIFTAFGTGTRDGSVYVYHRQGSSWPLEQQVVSDNAMLSGDGFGFAIALRDTEMVVGAPLEDDGGTRSGAGYYIQFVDGRWKQQQRFKAGSPAAENRFGAAVAFDGTTLVIDSPQEDVDEATTRAGIVYAYQKPATQWELLQRIVSPAPRAMAQFGYSIAVHGNTIVAAAPYNVLEAMSRRAGEVHVLELQNGKYVGKEVLTSPSPAVGDYFGQSLALSPSGQELVVGASGEYAPTSNNADALSMPGAAYSFTLGNAGFGRGAPLVAANGQARDGFGYAVGVTASSVIVGAPYEASSTLQDPADNQSTEAGAAYIIE